MTSKTHTPIEFIKHLLQVGDWFMSAIELEHDADGEVLEEEAKEIIKMVPECQTCQHWDRHPDNAYPSPTGTCKVIPHPNEHAAGRGLTTSPDFGCVKWESKT